MSSDNTAGFSRSEEYETQLYGFSSQDLFLHFKELVINEIRESTERCKTHLFARQKTEEDRAAAEKALDAFIAKCEEMSKLAIANLQENILTTFSIPSHILLPSDSVQRNSYTQEDELKEKEKLSKLKSRYRRAEFMKHALQEELAMASQLEGTMEMGKKVIAEIEHLKHTTKYYEKNSKKFHKIVQDLLGLEVKEASLKLSETVPWAENDTMKDIAIYNEYISS